MNYKNSDNRNNSNNNSNSYFVDEKTKEEQAKISRFIHLFLDMMIRGFDELEMQKRLELVDGLGFMINFAFEKTYGRMNDLDKRLRELERTTKKK